MWKTLGSGSSSFSIFANMFEDDDENEEDGAFRD